MDLTHRSRSRPRIGSVRRSALTFCLLFGLGLAVGWDSLDYSWNWDDLHLIRDYRAAELWGALVGPWDPDGIETAGWRPLTTLFNGGTYVLFGDVQSAHRLFRLGLFAAALTLLTNLVVRLGAAFLFALIGSTFAMAAKNSYTLMRGSRMAHALQLAVGAGPGCRAPH
jgi:hypothetical protein